MKVSFGQKSGQCRFSFEKHFDEGVSATYKQLKRTLSIGGNPDDGNPDDGKSNAAPVSSRHQGQAPVIDHAITKAFCIQAIQLHSYPLTRSRTSLSRTGCVCQTD